MSIGHLILIFLIVFLVFGAKRLPEIARACGQALNEFQKGKDEIADVANGKTEKKSVATAAPVAADKPVSTAEEKKNPVS